jgi:hypothetical protein
MVMMMAALPDTFISLVWNLNNVNGPRYSTRLPVCNRDRLYNWLYRHDQARKILPVVYVFVVLVTVFTGL